MVGFPNVPNAPGVPAIPRDPNAIIDSVILLAADALGIFSSGLSQQWGLYKDGLPVIIADSVVSFDYRQDWTISSYPLEEGAFESYDKVQQPFDVRLRFVTGGSEADREAMLSTVANAAASLDLLDAVTPEAIYNSVNVVHQDYKRDKERVGMIVIDVWLKEVRVTATSAFGNTQSTQNSSGGGTTTDISVRPGGTTQIVAPQSPSASPQVNDGTVQPSTASSSFASTVAF